MRLQAADIDWTQLDPVERDTLENVIPLLEEGFSHAEIADQIGAIRDCDAKAIEARVEALAARVMALSGSIELPPLSDEEYEALKQSIADHGQWMPILRGSPASGLPGEIVDGRHRRRACAQLHIEPKIVDVDGTADQLHSLGLVLNLARRHMSTSSRRGIIKAKLLADPQKSDRAIAAAVGVDHKTVGAVRRELEQREEVGKFPTRTGANGVAQPARPAEPPRPPEHRSIRVLVPTELYEHYVGDWVSCHAFRLVERRPGVHELQVQLLDAVAADEAQLAHVRSQIEQLAAKTGVDVLTAIVEMIDTASEVFGRRITVFDDLRVDEAQWLVSRIGVMIAEPN